MSSRTTTPDVPRAFPPFADLELEEYLCGDADPTLAARIEAAAAITPVLAAHLAERRAERDAFFIAHPRLPERADRAATASSRRAWFYTLALAGAAATLLFVVVPRDPLATGLGWDFGYDKDGGDSGGASGIRALGAFTVTLTVKRGEQTLRWKEGVVLRAGDQVRLTVQAPEAGYFALVSRDARGKVAVVYDAIATQAGTFALPDSLVLDDAPGPEEWFVMLGAAPPPTTDVAARLRDRGPLPTNAVVLVIAKEPPPQ